MGRVPNDQFVTQLTELLANSATAHSVYITKKRYTRGADGLGDAVMSGSAEGEPSSQFPILIRVTDGRGDKSKRVKFSTMVAPPDLKDFEALYLPALRSSLSASLRKRDKAKERKVDKLVVAARRKIEEQGGKVPLKGVGSSHRKRQRTAKRAAKARRDKAIQASKEGAGGAGPSGGGGTSAPPAKTSAAGAAATSASAGKSAPPATKTQGGRGGKGRGAK